MVQSWSRYSFRFQLRLPMYFCGEPIFVAKTLGRMFFTCKYFRVKVHFCRKLVNFHQNFIMLTLLTYKFAHNSLYYFIFAVHFHKIFSYNPSVDDYRWMKYIKLYVKSYWWWVTKSIKTKPDKDKIRCKFFENYESEHLTKTK